jgi:NDP-sugar pyrophosphorylase family protein
MFEPAELFDLKHTEHAAIFEASKPAWEALKKLQTYLVSREEHELLHETVGEAFIGPDVSIGEGTVVEDGVMIKGPAIIGRNCQIRHGAYFRENVIVGNGCVVGNSCELKNVLMFDNCQVPHFNYVGDSILGHRVHLGAGVIVSNVKVVRGHVMVEVEGQRVDSGLRKFGALLGDRAEIGCNAVLNPGSIIGRDSLLYPGVNWRGVLPSNRIVKNKAAVEVVERKAS